METIADIRQLSELGEDSIHIWNVHLADVQDRLDALHGFLSEKERKKAARYHRDSDRRSSIAARGALRVLLSGYTGISAAEIEFNYSGNGKPFLVPPASSRLSVEDACDTISFNVSHSAEWVVLAFGRNRNIGVDIEKIKREMDVMSIATRFFTPEEISLIENSEDRHAIFFRLWARKEAYVKACGSTLFSELGTNTEKKGWVFQSLEIDPAYAAAVVTNKELANVSCNDFGGLKWDS
ncbi:MAG: 4'-phosphopantetheinyl transferase superfamily protein [Verrucomicrobiota bacterium]